MNWIVEDFHAELGYKCLCEEIVKQGHNLKHLSLKDFYLEDTMSFPRGETTLFQGSLNMAKALLQKQYWKPTAWLNRDAYECVNYYPSFEGLLFNDKHFFTTIEQLDETGPVIWERFGRDGYIFIRPSSGMKTFGGSIETYEEYEKAKGWRKNFTKPTDVVLISTPKNILREWRFVTDGSHIVASSQYHKDGKHDEETDSPTNIQEFAKKVIARNYDPDPMWCFDVCEDGDGTPWLLEIGSFSCSGLYSCDMEPIVRIASALAMDINK